MLKLYKDLKISYYLVALVVGLTPVFSYDYAVPIIVFWILWILACAYFFQILATKRFAKTILEANNNCSIEDTLNRIYGVFNAKHRFPANLIAALTIANLLFYFGKNSKALDILLRYDAQKIFRRKSLLIYKYSYYRTLAVVYKKLDRNQEAIDCYIKSDAVYNDRKFPKKHRLKMKTPHRLAYLTIIENSENTDELLSLLKSSFSNEDMRIVKVSCGYSIIKNLKKCGRFDEAKEYVDYVKEFGGDTVYAKSVQQNDYSNEFFQKINNEPWKPKPIKEKHYITLIVSIVFTVCYAALSIFFLINPPVINNDNSGYYPHYYEPYINSSVNDLYNSLFGSVKNN